MTNILNFKLPASHSAMTGETRCRADASEIILFPGVRYERWTDASDAAPASDIAMEEITAVESVQRRRVE